MPPRGRKTWIELHGDKELAAEIEALGEALGGLVVLEAATDGADIALADARRRVPVDRGVLKNEIRTSVEVQKNFRAEIGVGVKKALSRKKGAFYAPFVELGHRLMKGKRNKKGTGQKQVGQVAPQPFLRPSVDENREEITRAVAGKLDEALKRSIR